MANRKLKVLINIGTDHQKEYGIPDGADDCPPKEGEVISVNEELANVLVNVLKVCKDHDQKAEDEHAEKVRKADAERMESEVAQDLLREQAKKDAEKAIKGK